MAYLNGNNLLFGAIGNNGVMLDQLTNYIPILVYGYSVTQADYDALTPETGKYYVILDIAAGEPINAVLELTQAEYDRMVEHGARTLYIITDGTNIANVMLGDMQAEKLYQGGEELWKSGYPEYDPSKTYNDGDIFVFNGKTYVVDSVNGSYIQSGNLITSETWSASNGFISGKIPTFTGSEMPETYASRWDYRTSGYVEVVDGATYLLKPGGSYSTMNSDMCHNLYAVKETRINHIKFFGWDYLNQQLSIPTGCNYIRLGLGPANYQPNPQFYRLYVDMPKVRELEE